MSKMSKNYPAQPHHVYRTGRNFVERTTRTFPGTSRRRADAITADTVIVENFAAVIYYRTQQVYRIKIKRKKIS